MSRAPYQTPNKQPQNHAGHSGRRHSLTVSLWWCVACGAAQVSHPNVLDMFERGRSAGLGGAVVLKERAAEAGNAFVVGRIDMVRYSPTGGEGPAVFGDRLEVRAPPRAQVVTPGFTEIDHLRFLKFTFLKSERPSVSMIILRLCITM